MATTFLDPGGDATFNVAATTSGGLWSTIAGTPTVETSPVHGSHIKSIKYAAVNNTYVQTATSTFADAGSRLSLYIYIVTMPSATQDMIVIGNGVGQTIVRLRITSAGILQLFEQTNQIGNDGLTLSTGIWYRVSLAFTITNTTTNRFELFINGQSIISITNATLTRTGSSIMQLGNFGTSQGLVWHTSDHYVDNLSSLKDTGDIWVTAKRPNANGTTNGFTTQIGAGGSGYGSGHSPQVNERALSTTNGWSMVGTGSAVTEEYNIEGKGIGDININGNTVVDCVGWAYMSSLAGETVQMILNGVNFSQAITSTNTMYTKIAGSTIYPIGSGADIGITTDTSLTTVSLFECGVMVAYIPSKGFRINQLRPRAFGPGLAR